jgi:hypothetical protein
MARAKTYPRPEQIAKFNGNVRNNGRLFASVHPRGPSAGELVVSLSKEDKIKCTAVWPLVAV